MERDTTCAMIEASQHSRLCPSWRREICSKGILRHVLQDCQRGQCPLYLNRARSPLDRPATLNPQLLYLILVFPTRTSECLVLYCNVGSVALFEAGFLSEPRSLMFWARGPPACPERQSWIRPGALLRNAHHKHMHAQHR